jgi:hypothetical protein
MPVRASDSIMLIEDMSPKVTETIPDLVLKVTVSGRNADVTSVIGKMITDDRAVLPSAVDNVHERSYSVVL